MYSQVGTGLKKRSDEVWLQSKEVVSFRVFEVSFGDEFRGGVSEHGPGQFRIRTWSVSVAHRGHFEVQACKNRTGTARIAPRN